MNIFKSAPVFYLRPKILGGTLGIIGAFTVFILTFQTNLFQYSFSFLPLFKSILPFYDTNFGGIIAGILFGFIWGYVLGWLIGYFHTLFMTQKMDSLKQTVFEIDPMSEVNIVPKEFAAPLATANPYTIAIVANPKILKADGQTEDDPILTNRTLFMRTVTRILRSFVNNELLALPEILNQMRFVIIFDNNSNSAETIPALCVELPASDILCPLQDVAKTLAYVKSKVDGIDIIDVIFVISASESLIRSSARFTEDDTKRKGRRFDYTFSTTQKKPNQRTHYFYPKLPGVVALSAWDDRLKTAVHEFAHAMSSLEGGAIVDEYLDRYNEAVEEVLKNNILNKKYRQRWQDPVPDVFGTYKLYNQSGTAVITQIDYPSDRYRCDKRENWLSYVPERNDSRQSCIMDVAYYGYEFDRLIFDFMYDRLLAKFSR
ncbi:MAG: hypothetical protein ONB16_11295 [candidate division KSB1 bacterium]|nr:hypothetical protein [candidate division KSB1 bacterium]MDZ7319569.1 hypothetical protein [candidate division KSB1 bacterium]